VKPVLGRLTVRDSVSIFIQQCRLVLPSPLVLSFLVALASLRAVSSCGLIVRSLRAVACLRAVPCLLAVASLLALPLLVGRSYPQLSSSVHQFSAAAPQKRD